MSHNPFPTVAKLRLATCLSSCLLLLALFGFSCAPRPETIAEEYKIGCMLPLSDVPSHQYGIWAKQGIDLAVEEINASGGIRGHRLVIDYQDDLGSGDEAAKIMSKFTNLDRYPIVFAYLSQPSAAAAPIARDTKTVLLTNTYTPAITENNEYVFRVGHNAGTDSRAMAEFLKTKLGDGPLAIMHVKTPAGDKASSILKTTYEQLGGNVVGTISYSVDEKDFRSLLLKIKSLNARIIYVYPYKELGVIIPEIRRLRINAVVATNNAIEEPSVIKVAGQALEGVVFTTPRFDPDSTDPVMAGYKQSFQKKYGVPSEVSAATWYDSVKIVAQAIEKGGYTAAAIRQTLLQTKNYPGVTGVITFKEDRDVDKPVIVKIVRNGQFVRWDQSDERARAKSAAAP